MLLFLIIRIAFLACSMKRDREELVGRGVAVAHIDENGEIKEQQAINEQFIKDKQPTLFDDFGSRCASLFLDGGGLMILVRSGAICSFRAGICEL